MGSSWVIEGEPFFLVTYLGSGTIISPTPIAYSIVKASIGSSLEALRAGKTPKKIPIRAQTQLAAHIES